MNDQTTVKLATSDAIKNAIERFERRGKVLLSLSAKYWRARRYLFVIGAVAAAAAFEFWGADPGSAVVALFIAAFMIVVLYHRRVLDSIKRNGIWIEMKRSGLARLNLEWEKIRPPIPVHPDQHHPFELDLDITGERSLHQLVDTCLTSEGSLRLRSWLLSTCPEESEIRRRQELVKELSTLTLFRKKARLYSALVGSQGPERWEAGRFLKWLSERKSSRSLLPVVIVLALLSAADLVLFGMFLWHLVSVYYLAPVLLYVAISYVRGEDTGTAFADAMKIETSLKRLLAIFTHLEKYKHNKRPGLANLCAPYLDPQNRPSILLKRVARITAALSFRAGNTYLWSMVELAIPWDFYFAHRMNQCRDEIARLMPGWLESWFELEALISLSDLAELNPDYTFPDVVGGAVEDGPVFSATKIGHPLLLKERKVANDFRLDAENRLTILTGSNMSGKSTFLRTIGVNLSLAYAGAPVNAERLTLSLFSLFTCIKVSDSVADGLSYFYAEVKRLKALLESVQSDKSHHHFILIDEIFRGTNNRERRIGSWAFIKRLSTTDCLGAVATHDLELVRLADEIPSISNYHFREDVTGGRMVFDYELRSGPSPTTNALKIMELEGLPVDPA